MQGPPRNEGENDFVMNDFVNSVEGDEPVSYVKGVIEGTVVPMLIDSGSSVSLISAEFRMSVPALRSRPLKKHYVAARAVNGQMLDTLGTISIIFCIGSDSWQHTFHVLRETTQAVLLGWDFLVKSHALLDIANARLQLWGATIPLLTGKDLTPVCCNVSVATAMAFPSLSEVMVPVIVSSPGPSGAYSRDFVGYLEPNIPDTSNLVVAHTVTTVKNGLTCARVLNPTKNDIVLQPGSHLGEFYPVDESDLETLPFSDVKGIDRATSHSDSAVPPVSLEDAPISSSQKTALSAILLQYKDIFNTSDRNTGKCRLVKHHIRTGNHPPIKQRAYRTSPEKRTEIERQVADLLADGVVEESCSPWASPVVLVKKKCGRWRFCVDYRRLNSVTVKDCHPLPRIDDTLDALAGAAWFSTLDFSNGYWQVEVAEEDREKTAFTTGRGLYQWRSMPMGLSNSPATFQRMMELVLRGLPWNICMVYLDDILLYNGSFEEHLASLEEVFSRIQHAGLKLNPSKCHLARNHVLFLGHLISQDGLKPDPKNTDKVKKWPTPQSPSEVRAFVGLCSYYRRFVQNFAKHAAPLNQLMGKNVPFKWTVNCEASFNYLKNVLSSPPVVALPDFKVPFKVFTDASLEAVGAVLAQEREGVEQVVSYASQSLNQTQRRWSTFDRELWAIVWAVREFRHYIGLAPFTIVTDHRPLLSLRRMAIDNDPTGRRGRWILELEPYNWEIAHKDGQRHLNADALSRRPDRECPSSSKSNNMNSVLVVNTIQATPSDPRTQGTPTNKETSTSSKDWTAATHERGDPESLTLLLGLAHDATGIRASQEADKEIQVALEWVQNAQKPPKARLRGASRCLRKFWTEFDRLEVQDGLLCRVVCSSPTGERVTQVVVPSTLVPEVLQQLHGGSASAHFATERVWEQARRICYWPSMFRDIRDWCEQCKACQRRRSPVPPHRAPMGSSSATSPFERVAMDIVELPVTTKGNRLFFFLCILCILTGLCICSSNEIVGMESFNRLRITLKWKDQYKP
ncbi:zinc finger protein 800a isoform X1 [Brachyhypopomus gauderio]|uniref:zinc finger protein 800a isoform X1 n=1 Tax=Brachyhypopomus gauderio TaxID=698409 RepID=UPI0040423B25